jgi:ABC-type transport system involved in multi-copper enzyme maturation permease subunit
VRAQLRAELLKQGSTRTGLGLFCAMLGLVLFAVVLHSFGVGEENLGSASDELTMVFGRGEYLGALFAALMGALSVTGEFRHGTIRTTFLVSPWRGRVVAAKVWVSMLVGAGFGFAACALAVGVGSLALRARGIELQLDGGDYALLMLGGSMAAALWAGIGVGLGAVVRDQVPTLVGICAWLLFVEGLLIGDVADIADVGRFAPGAAGAAISGQDPGTLLPPAAGLAVLALYAAAAGIVGARAISRRDVA